MSAYLVVEVDVKDTALYAEYKKLVPETITKYGGRYLTRGGRVETIEGNWTPARFVIVEFPSMERAKAWWASEEYAKAKAMRHAASTTQMVLAEGL